MRAVGPDGHFRVGNLHPFPVWAGASNIYCISPDGQISVETSGLTAVTGLAYVDGQLYVPWMALIGHPPQTRPRQGRCDRPDP